MLSAGDRGEFISVLANEAEADAKAHQNPLKDFKPRGALAANGMLEELKAVNAIVSEKATPEEAEAYRTGSGTARARLPRRPRRAASSVSTRCA